MISLLERMNGEIFRKTRCTNWKLNILKYFCLKFSGKMGEQVGDKIGCTFYLNIYLVKMLKSWGQHFVGEIRWNKWVDKLSGKSLRCTVYSVQ